MLRITRILEDGALRLLVEGRLTQSAPAELRAAAEESLVPGRPLRLDLAGVSFVGPEGVRLLRELERRGATFSGCSAFLTELLRGPVADAAAGGAGARGEGELVAALRRGDREASEVLVRQNLGRMLATARRLLGNEEDAREAVQEAFASALRGIGGFSGEARLATWLHRIVVNAALLKHRGRRRRPEEPIEDLLPSFDSEGRWVSGTAGFRAPTEQLLARREVRALVRGCIERLPEIYRSVLVLRDIEELDTEEAARALGVGSSVVKVRLHRARQALRTMLERGLRDGETPRVALAP